ncbi:uncharacterized protein ACRADG_008959 [Cochliomyia hominivorax]
MEQKDFEDDETLYTKCDYVLEENVHEYILKLEKLLKEHELLMEQEMKKQNELINCMWIQSQRYLLLTSCGVCVKPYPELVSLPTEKRALCSFYTSLENINKSNCILSQSIDNIRTCQTELNRLCEQLDMSIKSPFMDGNYSLRSLTDIRAILADLIYYFYGNLCKLKIWSQLLDPRDSVSIEDYMNLIKSNTETDLLENFNSCHCLRSTRTECIKEHKTC